VALQNATFVKRHYTYRCQRALSSVLLQLGIPFPIYTYCSEVALQNAAVVKNYKSEIFFILCTWYCQFSLQNPSSTVLFGHFASVVYVVLLWSILQNKGIFTPTMTFQTGLYKEKIE